MIDYGKGVYLGNINAKTLPLIFDFMNNRKIKYLFDKKEDLNWDNHVDWYHSVRKDPTIELFIIGSRDDKIIGFGGLTSIDRVNSRAEISLCIGNEFSQESPLPSDYFGYSVDTIVAHAMLSQNLNSVWVEALEGDPKNERFLACGFKKDGTLRQRYFREGQYLDANIYSLNRGDRIHD
jgi:RimJ/RimL family protein N-acetyltransferase